jgi:hypothetical protein
MNFSQLKNPSTREWIYFVPAVTIWVWFVLSVPSAVHYPWNVLAKFLGILSPFFWYKTLNITRRSEHEGETEPADSQGTLSGPKTSRLPYFILGTLAWGIFVINISPHPFSRQIVLRDVFGFLAPFLLLVRLRIDSELYPIVYPRVDHASGHVREPQFADTPARMPWILFFSSGALWIYFLRSVPDQAIFSPIALWLLIWALPWALSLSTTGDCNETFRG